MTNGQPHGVSISENLGVNCISSASRGYHIYHTYWSPLHEDILQTELDYMNPHDKYSVAIKKDNIIIGHIPRVQSQVCSYFIRRGGTIQFQVTSTRRRPSNLPQGGLEIPGLLIFFGHRRDTAIINRLITEI